MPARIWSPVSDVKAPFADESFQYYQGMKQLEQFSAGLTTLAWLDIGDEGVKRLAPLTQLKHLRLNNTTIKDPTVLRGAGEPGVPRFRRRLRARPFARAPGEYEEPEASEPTGHVGHRRWA